MNIERTLVLFKPDSVQRGIVGEILTRFERVGLKIVGTKMIFPDKEHYHKHYEGIGKMVTRRGEKALAMIFEGVEAVELVRKIVGGTEPKTAMPGTIRGDYSHMSFGYADAKGKGIPNLIHASGNRQEAEEEIVHWFRDGEIYDYSQPREKFTR